MQSPKSAGGTFGRDCLPRLRGQRALRRVARSRPLVRSILHTPWRGFFLVVHFAAVEVPATLLTHSLALLSDAAHTGTGALGLGLTLAAVHFGRRPGSDRRTYGAYRLEVLVTPANGLLLFGVGGYLLYDAYLRFLAPSAVEGLPMLVVAGAGSPSTRSTCMGSSRVRATV